jgi:flagellar basal-body rod protein FlgB
MNAVPRYDSLAFAENTLKLRTYRQQVLGNNLANSDTPGFKARDIQFADVLKAQLEGKTTSSSINLATTHAAHIPGKFPLDDPRLLYRIPNQPSMDGNTVDADIELSEFTKNSVLTEFAINRVGSTIKSRMSAITGQPS